MRIFIRILCLSSLLFLPVAAPADVVDRVVAVVNDEVITLSEVNEEGKALLQRVAENVSAAELPDALQQVRQTMIEKLIEKKIMLQEAGKANITVSDEEVNAAFERILARNNTTPVQFRAQLAPMGMTEEQFLENLRDQVLSSKLVNYEIRSKLIISENRIIDYYDTHYTERVGEGGYYILQIGVSFEEGDKETGDQQVRRQQARARAEHIRSLALAGEDFRDLARQYSELPSGVDGGDLGVVRKEDMSSSMLEAILKTKPGSVTDIIETPSGFQFFKVLSSQEGQIITKVPFESVRDEIYDTLYQQEVEAYFEDWMKKKKSQAYIKIL
ncbi:MAG: SurA N-terminal domain-containing protein [Desulfobulbaceae bacterium]|nr:SurA N-terminal domain-containing protein [Desulfobulbaceae bacterium]MDY0351061.1 SurA N-terminal domain-containing protein [Desulfobulbaceae bacterium]